MFDLAQVTYGGLLNALGGREMLELMINAQNFAPVSYKFEGLSFTFRVSESDHLRRAMFVPVQQSFLQYKIEMSIKAQSKYTYELVKLYHSVILTRPENLVKTFEATAKVALAFP
jgi:hypothetical protein